MVPGWVSISCCTSEASSMTAAADRYHARVRQLPCVATLMIEGRRVPSTELHHVESSRDALSEFLVIPLSFAYHSRQSPISIHTLSRRGFERTYKVSELKMLAKVQELLA